MAPSGVRGIFMSYYQVDENGTFRIYEYAPDRSTFSGYSSVLSEKITLDELIVLYKNKGFNLTFEKIDKCTTT